MTLAGLKKCRPSTSCGRCGRGGDGRRCRDRRCCVARIAPGFAILSSAPKICCLTPISSKAASMTMSASAAAWSPTAPVIRASRSSRASGVSEPRVDRDARRSPRCGSCRCRSAPASVSISVTGMPALAKHMAMPPPIVPAPITAAVAICARLHARRDARHLGGLALGEEDMAQRLASAHRPPASMNKRALRGEPFTRRAA